MAEREHLNADEQIAEMIRIIEDREGCDVVMGLCHTSRRGKCSWCAAERLYDAGYRKVIKDGD